MSPIHAAARTHPGLERPSNQDRGGFGDVGGSITFEPPSVARMDAELFVGFVCDGMGGEAGGEIASGLAVETILPFLRSSEVTRGDDWEIGRAMIAAVEAASATIRAEAQRSPRYARMGTTATLAALSGRTLLVAQVGDSRAYVFRRGELVQVTRDQTMVEYMRAAGLEVPEIGHHIILQAVGSTSRLEIPITRTPLETNDVVLLCSDGLCGPVSDHDIAAVLASHRDLEAAADELTKRALLAGGPDNVTSVLFQILG